MIFPHPPRLLQSFICNSPFATTNFRRLLKSEKRNIEDNLLLKNREKDAESANCEINILTSELGGIDGKSFAKQRQTLEKKYSILKEEVRNRIWSRYVIECLNMTKVQYKLCNILKKYIMIYIFSPFLCMRD